MTNLQTKKLGAKKRRYTIIVEKYPKENGYMYAISNNELSQLQKEML